MSEQDVVNQLELILGLLPYEEIIARLYLDSALHDGGSYPFTKYISVYQYQGSNIFIIHLMSFPVGAKDFKYQNRYFISDKCPTSISDDLGMDIKDFKNPSINRFIDRFFRTGSLYG